MNKSLQEKRKLVAAFQKLVTNHPDHKGYQDALAQLQQEEVNLISQIGKKK